MIALPKRLLFEVTTRCNYRCPFCYCVWHEFPELAGPELDTVAWKSIIDECAERGVKEITFTGGEATLRDDIWELMDYACNRLHGGDVALFTNGSLMTEARINWCKERRIRLSTSLQGLRTYGRQTGTRRSYKRILMFMARAAELAWPVDVSISVSRVNLDEIADIYAAAVLSQAKCIQVNPMMVEGKMRKHPELALTPAEWDDVKKTIEALPDGGIPRCFSDEILCHCRFQPTALQQAFGIPTAHSCPAGRSFGVIGPSGLFRKCLHTVKNLEWR